MSAAGEAGGPVVAPLVPGEEPVGWPECPGCRRARRGGLPSTFRRADRSFAEILQEVRVVQTGVQLLVAFLLTAPFAPEFAMNTTDERVLYVTSLIAGVLSSALLIAPVPFHRLVYRRRMKRELVRASNRLTQYAMALMLISVVSALALVLVAATSGRTSALITSGAVAWFVGWWYAMPLLSARRARGLGCGE
jgi:Family of unknown function (DUF6328)